MSVNPKENHFFFLFPIEQEAPADSLSVCRWKEVVSSGDVLREDITPPHLRNATKKAFSLKGSYTVPWVEAGQCEGAYLVMEKASQ